MIRHILKYAIDLDTMSAQHSIPEGSWFLSLQVQNGVPVMWWSTPTHPEDFKLRTFVVAPTGPPGYTDNLHYVGTFQIEEGLFVGHVMSCEPIPTE